MRPQSVRMLDVGAVPPGERAYFALAMIGDGLADTIHIPVIVVRGVRPGPVVGITAALHGNELNGVRVIHDLLGDLRPEAMSGAVVAVPVVNVPGYLLRQREFNDGVDLNRVMPGNPRGTTSQVYAHRLVERVLGHLDFLVDLHTASFGRINSLYVRADLRDETSRAMALAQGPDILLHNPNADGTLRGEAAARGVPAITVEIGNPNRFQQQLIVDSHHGVERVLVHLGVLDGAPRGEVARQPFLCRSSYWIYTTSGGLLEVLPALGQMVEPDVVIARVNTIYGFTLEEYRAPERGIVIGRSIDPVNQTGSRILHLGIPGTLAEILGDAS